MNVSDCSSQYQLLVLDIIFELCNFFILIDYIYRFLFEHYNDY